MWTLCFETAAKHAVRYVISVLLQACISNEPELGMVVGARRAGLRISEMNDLLGF